MAPPKGRLYLLVVHFVLELKENQAGNKEAPHQVDSMWLWSSQSEKSKGGYLQQATNAVTGSTTCLRFTDPDEINHLFHLGYFNTNPGLSLEAAGKIARVETICTLSPTNRSVEIVSFYDVSNNLNKPVLLGSSTAIQLRQTVERLWMK